MVRAGGKSVNLARRRHNTDTLTWFFRNRCSYCPAGISDGMGQTGSSPYAGWHTSRIGACTTVPNNGEINKHFGVYRSLCCGREVIVREGATFPDCPNHPKLSTVWKLVGSETIPITEIKKKSESDAAT